MREGCGRDDDCIGCCSVGRVAVGSNAASSLLTVPPGADEEEEGRAGMLNLGMPGLRGFFGGISDMMLVVYKGASPA